MRLQSTEYVAVDLLKKAGMNEIIARQEVAQKLMEKEAANYLTSSGIDYDVALEMVKVAGVKIKDLAEFKIEPTPEEVLSERLEKAASLAQELEVKAADYDFLLEKVAQLEAQLADKPEIETVSEPMQKFAKSGAFTNEDLAALKSLSTETLTKVASLSDQPWSLGKSVGQDVSSLDPLAAFCLS
jgi:hypothetical protein